MIEDWSLLLSFFPNNWIELAGQTDALKKLRKDKDVENYLRTLLLHIGCGYSLRETATRAKLAWPTYLTLRCLADSRRLRTGFTAYASSCLKNKALVCVTTTTLFRCGFLMPQMSKNPVQPEVYGGFITVFNCQRWHAIFLKLPQQRVREPVNPFSNIP